MSNIDWDERQRENIYHAEFPVAGDYWEEMFSGQYLIVVVTTSLVALCQDKKAVDDQHWQFDLSKITVLTREQFSDKVRYSTPSMNHKTWCDVHPGALADDAAEALEAGNKALSAYRKVANPSWLTRLINRIRAALKVRLIAWGEAL
jgi:hypothetical protein